VLSARAGVFTMLGKLEKHIDEINRALRAPGLLLVSGFENPNIMAVHWATFGCLWGKPVFATAIKKTRRTYGLLEGSGVFTVNVPRKDITDAIMKIGLVSGHEVDKFGEFHLHPVKAKNIDTYIVSDCGIHLECRVIYKSPVDEAALDAEIKKDAYDGD
jgi:flavin reductase (DIM6/NTAB) family NADH-FMN oxidoreductase RutF